MKKSTIFLSLFMMLAVSVNSQTLKVFEEWTTSGGTQNMFLETFTETDANRNVYVGGATINSTGDYDILLTKYNPDGGLEWTVQYAGPGNGDDGAAAICIGDSGNVYLTGTVYFSSNNQNDCIVLKYDCDGDLKWARTYNGDANEADFGTDICIDENNNVFIAGACTRNSPMFDFLVLKYDCGGNFQWVNFYDYGNLFNIANKIEKNDDRVVVAGGHQVDVTSWEYAIVNYDEQDGNLIEDVTTSSGSSGIDKISDLIIDDAGNLYVTGGSVNANTGYDFETIKLNDTLAVLWTVNYNGNDSLDDMARSIKVDTSGNVFVTGYSLTQDEDTNIVTIKYDSSGVEQWVEEYNDNNDGADKGEALVIDESGNIYVAASSFNGSNSDYLTLKYNTDGELQWEITYNGLENQDDEAKDICIDGDGDIIVVGQSGTGDEFKYLTVKYTEIDVIIPPDDESRSSAISYIENMGQLLKTDGNAASDVKFYSEKGTPEMYFSDEEISLVFKTYIDTLDTMQCVRVNMSFHEANPEMKIRSFDQRDDYFNYYLPHISQGRTRVNGFDRLIYSELYDDIDLMYTSNNAGWKYYYIIKPGGDPEEIEFTFSGADTFYIDANDSLIIETAIDNIIFPKGEAYQIASNGSKITLNWDPEFSIDGSSINTDFRGHFIFYN